jgi:hypothetical protein
MIRSVYRRASYVVVTSEDITRSGGRNTNAVIVGRRTDLVVIVCGRKDVIVIRKETRVKDDLNASRHNDGEVFGEGCEIAGIEG